MNYFGKQHSMNKKNALPILLSAALIITLSTMPCTAGSGKKKLLLFAKNPTTWKIVKNGGSGKLVYHQATGAFTVKASGLHPRSSYALVRYADASPQGDIVARGRSDHKGKLELNGIWYNWTNKFWIVAGEDVSGNVGENGMLKAWRPERYLFEGKPLGIACNCPEPEEP